MFCPQCGKQIEEGKGFCKHCGARLSDYAPAAGPTPAAPPPANPPAPPVSDAWPIAPPPPPFAAGPAAVPPPPPVPPPFPASPATVPPVPPHVLRGERPGWVIPFLAVMGVIIVGSIVGLVVVLSAGAGDSPRATGTVGTATTLSVTTTVSGPPTETTIAGGGVNTTATIPGYDPNSTTVPTSTGGSGADPAAYVGALDDLESVLYYADSRIPDLAKEINASAPQVPVWVSDELQGLSDNIQTAQDELSAHNPPADFQRADDLLFQASGEMLYRIDQTYQGIDAMSAAGTVAAGNPYFEEGRKARDAYRTLYDEYRATRPWN